MEFNTLPCSKREKPAAQALPSENLKRVETPRGCALRVRVQAPPNAGDDDDRDDGGGWSYEADLARRMKLAPDELRVAFT